VTTIVGLHHVEHVMGMAVSIDVRDNISRDAIDEVVTWLHHVDATFSTYKMDSPISRLGSGEFTLDDMSDEVLGVLAMCEALNADTNGAFDVLAVLAPNGNFLDPSGLVKGWSIELAAEMLSARGANNFCINAGGDIAIRGEAAPGQPWRVGIRHPDHAELSAAVINASGRLAVATSATYERGAHIIDPASGAPIAEVASVTIVGPDLTYADAYATSVFVMGVPGLSWLHDNHPDYAGFLITHDDRALSTQSFDQYRV
jgi:thiamine biosynthesis lipoprotein